MPVQDCTSRLTSLLLTLHVCNGPILPSTSMSLLSKHSKAWAYNTKLAGWESPPDTESIMAARKTACGLGMLLLQQFSCGLCMSMDWWTVPKVCALNCSRHACAVHWSCWHRPNHILAALCHLVSSGPLACLVNVCHSTRPIISPISILSSICHLPTVQFDIAHGQHQLWAISRVLHASIAMSYAPRERVSATMGAWHSAIHIQGSMGCPRHADPGLYWWTLYMQLLDGTGVHQRA